MKKPVLLMIFVLSLGIGIAINAKGSASREVSFTLEDRDRIMQTQIELASLRTEMNTRFESMQQQMNTRLDSMNTRFDSMQKQIDVFYWGFGIVISLILFQFGYMIWDRRTAMEPLREHTTSLIQTLREYAKEQPKLADILRSYGLM